MRVTCAFVAMSAVVLAVSGSWACSGNSTGPTPAPTFQTDWNAFVDGINACFASAECKAQTGVNVCSCVTSKYERQTVTWQGGFNGRSGSDAVSIQMPARTVTATTGATVTVGSPILLQTLSAGELSAWSSVAAGTQVRFRTNIGIIRIIGTGFVGSGSPTLLVTTSGGERLP